MSAHRILRFGACAAMLAFAASGVVVAQTPPVAASSGANANANNTRINQRDRSMDTTTPVDQPNNHVDIQLAAAVRRALVKDDALSSQAHNIKLVASNGVVTLRGPVASADEKSRVQTAVSAVPGVVRVDNQLDIQP
jgi:hyperosmotically inducible periplasmic protein